MNKLILDVETIPNQDLKGDLKPQFNEDTVKLGALKDPEKIKAKLDKARVEFETGLTKKMSLESNYCQILSIGYIEIDPYDKEIRRGVIFDKANDKIILARFISSIYNGQTIIGWNSKNFDIPVIRKRCILQGLGNPFPNFKKLIYPYGSESIDMMHEWNGPNQYGKMSLCADLLGIENKTGLDGSQIYQAWKDERYDEIESYNLQDCDVTLSIYRRIYT